jgi:ElaA protein
MDIDSHRETALHWKLSEWNRLDTTELYEILQLRNRVFVVEQNCVYNDTDGKDRLSHHLCGYTGKKLICYARLLPPGVSYTEPSIGRVVCDPEFRKKGIGTKLMLQAIHHTRQLWPQDHIKISAQSYLLSFYISLGFSVLGTEYLEDGIPHREMIL